MKIALIAPVEETVPPQGYGGTEWIVYHLAHGLGKKGHEVDLYAAGNSQIEEFYKILPITPLNLRQVPETAADPKTRESGKFVSISKTIKYLLDKKYDVINNHAGWRFFSFASLFSTPTVTIQHRPFTAAYENYVYSQHKDFPFISISNNQRRDFPDLNFIATVYNGIDVAKFPYFHSEDIDQHSYLAFLARLNAEKGAIEAATIAKQMKKVLKIGAKVDLADQPYFETFKPLIDKEYIQFKGEVKGQERIDLLQKARALFVPIKWEEPFGLMFTEAMACGTPVITFARGSAPEIIKDGETGFLVNQSPELKRGDYIIKKTGLDGLKEAVERIYSLSPEEYKAMRLNSRSHVEKNFSVEQMVDGYEKAFHTLLK